MKKIRAASVQFEHVNGDKACNLQTMEAFIKRAAVQNVDVIAFPECCVTGYWFLRNLTKNELRNLAEPVGTGETCLQLAEYARTYQMTVCAGMLEIDECREIYNTYVVVFPDGTVHSHRKIHTFISPFARSGNTFTVFETPYGWKFGILICYDNNIIENVRMTALKGADLILAPHQTGGCASKSPHAMTPVDQTIWEERYSNPKAIEEEFKGPKGREWLLRWLPSRAHDNGVFIIFSNGVGRDDDEIRTGNAMILDPYGRILVETWKAGDDMVVCDLDPALFHLCTGRRWMRTRKPELYQEIAIPTGHEQDTRRSRFGNDF